VEDRRRAEQERLRIERVAEEAARRNAERERREAEQRLTAEREGARRAEQERIERVLAEEERRLAAEHEARRREEQEHARLEKALHDEERRLAVEFEQRRRAERDGERLAQLRPGVSERPEIPALSRSLHEQLVRIGCAEAPIDGDRERVRGALDRFARRVGRPAPLEITKSLVDELRALAPLPCG
jgi:colicin import membrane protein